MEIAIASIAGFIAGVICTILVAAVTGRMGDTNSGDSGEGYL